MVVQGDFEVKIVSAVNYDDEGDREPFKEHEKDGVTYVEVEPDSEYYIAVRCIADVNDDGVLPKPLVCKFMVDGKDLGWKKFFTRPSETWRYTGLFGEGRVNCSLKFAKPDVVDDVRGEVMKYSYESYKRLMGEIKVEVHEGKYQGKRTHGREPKRGRTSSSSSSWSETPRLTTDQKLSMFNRETAKLKYVRTTNGEQKAQLQDVGQQHRSYRILDKIDTIVLKYATAPGLIMAGLFLPTTAAADENEDESGSINGGNGNDAAEGEEAGAADDTIGVLSNDEDGGNDIDDLLNMEPTFGSRRGQVTPESSTADSSSSSQDTDGSTNGSNSNNNGKTKKRKRNISARKSSRRLTFGDEEKGHSEEEKKDVDGDQEEKEFEYDC